MGTPEFHISTLGTKKRQANYNQELPKSGTGKNNREIPKE